MADVESEIFDIIAQKANIERNTLTRATELSDVKLESIDMLEIIFEVEEKFNIAVSYNANQGTSGGFKTAGDVVDFIKSHMTQDAGRQAV
jgi:acyl carrier protein